MTPFALLFLILAHSALAFTPQQPLHWPRPHSPSTGIPADVYADLVRFTKYASAVYQFICPRPLGNVLVSEFTNLLTGTHGLVARDEHRGEIVVAFRGSQQLPDLVTDANVVLVPFEESEAHVHAGFAIAYASVARVVRETVRGQLAAYPGFTLVCTGHSMGGALAVLAGLELKAAEGVDVRVFTFGQPRTGDEAFADLVEDAIGREHVFRAVHTWDGVPTVIPRSLGYQHHGTEYWQIREPASKDSVVRCDGQEDKHCSLSIPSTGINLAHDVYFGQVMTADATLCL